MVDLFHVSIFFSDWSFCCTFSVLLFGPSSHHILDFAKTLEGKAPFKYSVPSVINGGITALYFILWGKGLKTCGPLRAILAEYSGAVLGVLSAVLYGRRGFVWKKVGGLIAMLVSFYFLSQGWAMATHFPFSSKDGSDSKDQTEQDQTELVLGSMEMAIPIFAGILSALRRVIARRVSLKNQLKRRLHAITMASATCFLFPLAMWDMIIGSTLSSDTRRELPFSTWAFLSTIIFGVILIFYVDSIAEERLHVVFSSPRHLVVAGGSIILLETVYKMDFSLIGFIICCSILGFGLFKFSSILNLLQFKPYDRCFLSNLPMLFFCSIRLTNTNVCRDI
ncbi:uncharacterized protein LOC111789182 isoform X6 [Cucurbita pepo subsp. pepo]|uniref:uncharacterized protein LOC111789182 isoform X6 n=1 Tax=Cucurbita pepo subsp. pepo TaxID=3664 RepID=UPI000C9D4115|nr:uncharacterized protein LOC111789182 isoform X6 [Cucurbita pepo subsp. pepo]